jgi:3-phytase
MQKILAFFIVSWALTSCSSVNHGENQIESLSTYILKDPYSIGKTLSEQELFLGGFSGLRYLKTEGDRMHFVAITDRGPNGWQIKENRPFLLPEYSPLIVNFFTENRKDEITIESVSPLKKSDTSNITGLPNSRAEENPIDVFGFTYSIDQMGLDTEGIELDGEGGFWISDEYAPSLVHFNSSKKFKRRLMPTYELPRSYSERKTNRGFEGVAKFNELLFGVLQSPLPTDSGFSRIVEFNLEQHKVTAEYFYPLDKDSDRIGDIYALSKNEVLVIEQNGKANEKSYKKIYKAKFNKSDELVTKTLLIDLNKTNFKTHEKVEGLTLIDSHTIAVVNDNDFKINGETDFKTGITPFNNLPTEMLVIKFKNKL